MRQIVERGHTEHRRVQLRRRGEALLQVIARHRQIVRHQNAQDIVSLRQRM